jgi:magnesium and cobalt exporter, CNNM family
LRSSELGSRFGAYLHVPFSDVVQLIGMGEPPSGDYVTLAGFVLSQLHELPKPGDHVVCDGWRFEVVDTDGKRIDMILVQRQSDETSAVKG